MKFKNLSHFFLPHPQTHEKAHLLHWHYLLIYLLLFILLKTGFELVTIYKPGVLGVNSNITVTEIVDDTNKERAKLGLPPVTYNETLSKAAAAKAANMFQENYWAHYSPSGKDPWGFILSSGYKFSYAGENLARNFYNSSDVVVAWMNSPTHKENIVNKNYREIGVAVVDGVLQGQKTTLVVQMFGTPYEAVAAANPGSPAVAQVDVSGQKTTVPVAGNNAAPQPLTLGTNIGSIAPALADPNSIIRTIGFGFILLIGGLLILDWVVLKKRGVFRLSSHHVAHLSLLALTGTSLITHHTGQIL